jgi:NADH dehydrogenase
MVRDFRRIRPESARVILLEGRERVLPPYPGDLSEKARKQLAALGVEVITGARVTDVSAEAVTIGDRSIATRTILWGAGVQASPLAQSLGVPLDPAGRVLVEPDLTIPGHREVFVIGDLAALKQPNGEWVPGVAPAAIQEGKHTAGNLRRALEGQPLRAFRYRDKGSLATIGRAAAVADFGRLKLSGFMAWLAWIGVHIFFLIGFRNRLLVITQWAWAYVTKQRGARLITGR